MTIISSQHYIDWSIVERKMEELNGSEKVMIPCAYIGEIYGEEYAIQMDGHHTMAAARKLGIQIEYEIGEDPEGLMGDNALEARYMDGDYYDVEKSDPAYDVFALVF